MKSQGVEEFYGFFFLSFFFPLGMSRRHAGGFCGGHFGGLIGYQTHVMALSQVTWTNQGRKMTNGAWTIGLRKKRPTLPCWIDDTAILLCNNDNHTPIYLNRAPIPPLGLSRSQVDQVNHTYNLKVWYVALFFSLDIHAKPCM